MMLQTFLNVVSLCLLIALIGYLTFRLSTVKHGVWRCLVGAYLYGDWRCRHWLKENKVFVWYFILDIALIIIFLGLNSQFAKDSIRLKPLTSFLASPLVWLSMLFILQLHDKERQKRLKAH